MGGKRVEEDVARHSLGFTLIELLIVVAVIAILVAIAIPNFLQAQVRAKVARSIADLRTIGTALELYHTDTTSYPLANNYSLAITPPDLGPPITLERLSTPIAYVRNFDFRDPFGVIGRYYGAFWDSESPVYSEEAQYYKYAAFNARAFPFASWQNLAIFGADPAMWWTIEGVGPDHRYHNMGTVSQLDGTNPAYDIALANKVIYDPTNGTVSRGSVWRVGGDQAGPGQALFLVISTRYGG